MTKELQDLAWSVLPKEFKEEVKKEYRKGYVCETLTMLITLFGHHNLTSDAEGEEMLTVPRKRVQAFFMNFKCEKSDAKSTFDKVSLGARMSMLHELFGSKCLPDDSSKLQASCRQVNVDSLSQNPTENCDNKSHISADCNKPAEPKFKLGDEVKDISSPHDGGIYKVDDIKKSSDGFIYHIQGLIGESNVKESDLEPYTEPKENVNLSQPMSDCNKQFDNIIKDGFRNECRLNIATRVLCGMMADPISSNIQGKPTPVIVEWAYEIADALIAKAEKGAER